MKYFLLIISALILSACAAPMDSSSETPPPSRQNQPHLPPPDFPISETQNDTRYCGGMVRSEGPECAANEFCRRTIGDLCGAADASGTCTVVPQMCTQDYRPVCGCDGNTYSNECTANAKGISASYAGECR